MEQKAVSGLADLIDLTETSFAKQVHEQIAAVQDIVRLKSALLLVPHSLQLPAVAVAMALNVSRKLEQHNVGQLSWL